MSPDVEYIVSHAERLVEVGTVCVITFGLADGLNDALRERTGGDGDWGQAAAGFQDSTMMMAALRTAILLDSNERRLSFQGIHRRLQSDSVRAQLLELLCERHPIREYVAPSNEDLIKAFMDAYAEIDWEVHGRLIHLRNRGIAHLTLEKLNKSIRLNELRAVVSVVGKLTAILQHMCQTQTAFREVMLEDYREMARKTMLAVP